MHEYLVPKKDDQSTGDHNAAVQLLQECAGATDLGEFIPDGKTDPVGRLCRTDRLLTREACDLTGAVLYYSERAAA